VDKSEDSTWLSTGGCPKSEAVLLVFAKQPVAGQVKTRLTPALTSHQAAAFYAFSQQQTIETLCSVHHDLVICYSGAKDYFEHRYPQCALIAQGEGTLGERLTRAFKLSFLHGWKKVAAVGTDSPDLPLEQVEHGLDELDRSDVALIAAEDGGYVFAASRRYIPQMFENITWSSEKVLEQTVERLVASHCSYCLLGPWEDIDDLPSLNRLIHRCPDSRCSRYAQRCLRLNAAKGNFTQPTTGE